MRLNLARTLPRSRVNGPGERFVAWTQGCPLACPGCWNQDTWDFRLRQACSVDELVGAILATDGIEGLTLTGGEPFAQARGLAEVARQVRAAGLSVLAFTGYTLDELRRPAQQALLTHCDAVVAGRYVRDQRRLDLPWRGSANQQVHFLTERYGPADLDDGALVELHLGPDGRIAVTGFPPEELLRA